MFNVNVRPSKIRSLHTYDVLWMFYFGWIYSISMNLGLVEEKSLFIHAYYLISYYKVIWIWYDYYKLISYFQCILNRYSSFCSIHGGSSVRTYLDCHWITTQVLHKHALNVPKDTDLIIGYMFQVRTTNKRCFTVLYKALHPWFNQLDM